MPKPVSARPRRNECRLFIAALVFASLCLASYRDWARGSSSESNSDAPAQYIVALRIESNLENVLRDYHLHPARIYRQKLKGFSTMLDAPTAARLKADSRVAAIQSERAANAIVILGSQTDPAAIAREFGVNPSYLYTKALKGFAAPMDGEKIAQLEADQPTGNDKRMRITSVGLDGAAMHIVTLRRDADPDAVAREIGLKPYQVFKYALRGFATAMTSVALAKLDADDRVLAVESEGEMSICGQTVPAGIATLQITNFPVAHIDGGDHRIGVDVAVVDTGIQTNHPDLNVVQAVSFAPGGDGNDLNGHGTEVAGIIGALDNDIGVVGVAPGVRLWAVQVFSGSTGPSSQVIAGLDYVAAHGNEIAVANASIAGAGNPPVAIHEAVEALVNQGVVFVAAAGNAGADIVGADGVYGTVDDVLPAALPETMAVSGAYPYFEGIGPFNFSAVPHSPSA